MSTLTSFDAKWCPTYHSLCSVASKHDEDSPTRQDKIELHYIPYASQYYGSNFDPPASPDSVISNISPISTFPADIVARSGIQRDLRRCLVVGTWRATDHSPLQCHEWLPQELDDGFLIAAGFGNGRVSLIRFGLPKHPWVTENALAVGEVMQRNPRMCMAVAWNRVVRGQLGIALEKQRFKNTILVYQVESTSPFNSMLGASATSISNLGSSRHPVRKFGFETSSATALCWLPDQAHVLAAGTSGCFLRLYDTRMNSIAFRSSSVQHSSAIVGIAASPLQSYLIASWSKSRSDQVNIWDIRRLSTGGDSTRAVVSIAPYSEPIVVRGQPGGPRPNYNSNVRGGEEGAPVSVVWSPIEAEVLATLSSTPSKPVMPGSSASATICLWNIKRQLAEGRGRPELSNIFYVDFPASTDKETAYSPSCLSWQKMGTKPFNNSKVEKSVVHVFPNRMLVGVKGLGVVEMGSGLPTTMGFSSTNDIVWACGAMISTYSKQPLMQQNSGLRMDISEIMHERASKGYGLNVATNLLLLGSSNSNQGHFLSAEDFTETAALRRVWEWVARMDSLSDTSASPRGNTVDLPNVPAAVGEGSDFKASTFSQASWGVARLLKAGKTKMQSEPRISTHPILHREVYMSSGRQAAILACGWADFSSPNLHPKPDGDTGASVEEINVEVNMMVEKCENIGDFERSAALAVFRGDLHSAVRVLQRGVDFIEQCLLDATSMNTKKQHESAPSLERHTNNENPRSRVQPIQSDDGTTLHMIETNVVGKAVEGQKSIESTEWDENSREELEGVANLLRLVSMCLSGYGLSGRWKDSSSAHAEWQGNGLWRDACKELLRRPDMCHPKHADIRMACIFLLYSFEEMILEDTTLCLADRIAIACRYLPWEALVSFIDRCVDKCISEGNLEGVLLLGLGTEGMKLLQAYLDRTGDVQTVALLDCLQEIGKFGFGNLKEESITTPDIGAEDDGAVTASGVHTTSRVREWMSCYRRLLNCWEMWHTRATLDIACFELAAESRVVDPSYTNASFRMESGILGQTKGNDSAGGGTAARPPHLNVCCMFCKQNLPLSSLRHQQNMSSAWLRNQKPVLACCPACRKPLPRCYVCLSPLGCMNPYLEARKSPRNAAAGQKGGKDGYTLEKPRAGKVEEGLDGLSCMPLDEWWSFCVFCKHGGHANHILSWMSTHSECGVSGCDCKCSLIL